MANSSGIDVDEIISNLKATIMSNKGGVPLSNLESDYVIMNGEPLPYKKLGFNTVVDLIKSFNVFSLHKLAHDYVVNVVSGGKTSHLTEMIKRQKTSKKAKSKKPLTYKNTSLKFSSNYNTNTVPLKFKKKPPETSKYNASINYTSSFHATKYVYRKKPTANHKFTTTSSAASHPTVTNTSPGVLARSTSSHINKFNSDRPQKTDPIPVPSYPSQPVVNQMKLEEKCKKTVKVTAICNSSSIWVVIIDNEDYDIFSKMEMELNTNVDTKYNNQNHNPIVGRYYALHYQQAFYRVIVQRINPNCSIQCFFIDTGVSACVNKSQLYPLESKFLNICGQAMEIVLNKLASIKNFPFMYNILTETLSNNQFILLPNSVITYPLTATLYDIDTKMNVNDLMKIRFYDKVTPTLSPDINDNSVKAKVLSIENGYCYLLKHKDLLKSLENLFSTNSYLDSSLKCKDDVKIGNILLATYKHNIIGRVLVENYVNALQVKVYFVDYGCYKIVKKNELINFPKTDLIIARIPYQVVKVILHMFPPQNLTREIADIFYDILKNNKEVSVYVLEEFQGKIPCVQLVSDSFPNTDLNMVVYSRLGHLKKKNDWKS